MPNERLERISQKLESLSAVTPDILRFCAAGKDILKAAGVSLCLVANQLITNQSGTSPEFTRLDEQQFTMGDGPTFEAQHSPEPVVVDSFRSRPATLRFPVFSQFALENEVSSALAIPLRIGESVLGIMTAYGKDDTSFAAPAIADGVVLASLASLFIVSHLSKVPTNGLSEEFGVVSADQSLIHFAAGMVAEQLNMPIIDALVRMRSYAYRENVGLGEIAQRIARKDLLIGGEEEA